MRKGKVIPKMTLLLCNVIDIIFKEICHYANYLLLSPPTLFPKSLVSLFMPFMSTFLYTLSFSLTNVALHTNLNLFVHVREIGEDKMNKKE